MFTVLAPVYNLQSNPSGSNVLVPALAAVDGGVGEQLFVTSRNRGVLRNRPQTSLRFSLTVPALTALVGGDDQLLLAHVAQTCKAMCPRQLYQRTFTLAEVHARVKCAVSDALAERQQEIDNAVEETLGQMTETIGSDNTHQEYVEVVEYGMTKLIEDIGCRDELRNSAYFRRSSNSDDDDDPTNVVEKLCTKIRSEYQAERRRSSLLSRVTREQLDELERRLKRGASPQELARIISYFKDGYAPDEIWEVEEWMKGNRDGIPPHAALEDL